MSKVGHTPGPWHVLGKDEYVVDADGFYIANLLPKLKDAAEKEANAHLIAAAPELLEACLKLKQWAWAYEPNSMSLELRAVINQACSAITYAEGRA